MSESDLRAYGSVINDLRGQLGALQEEIEERVAERARLETALVTLEERQSGLREAMPQKTIAEAAIEFLEARGQWATTRQIADGLLATGFETQARDFPATVLSVLTREVRNPASPLFRDPEGDWHLDHWVADDDEPDTPF